MQNILMGFDGRDFTMVTCPYTQAHLTNAQNASLFDNINEALLDGFNTNANDEFFLLWRKDEAGTDIYRAEAYDGEEDPVVVAKLEVGGWKVVAVGNTIDNVIDNTADIDQW